jgi:hypothetical protein
MKATVSGFAQQDEGRQEQHPYPYENGKHYKPETYLLDEIGARRKNQNRNDDKQGFSIGSSGSVERFPSSCLFHWLHHSGPSGSFHFSICHRKAAKAATKHDAFLYLQCSQSTEEKDPRNKSLRVLFLRTFILYFIRSS